MNKYIYPLMIILSCLMTMQGIRGGSLVSTDKSFYCFTGNIPFYPTEEARDRLPELNDLLSSRTAITITNREFTIYESKNPQVLQCDMAAISQLYLEEDLYSTIKVIKIVINGESAGKIDLNRLISFNELEYIQFIYKYDACGNSEETCLKAHAENLISGYKDDITGLYQSQITR